MKKRTYSKISRRKTNQGPHLSSSEKIDVIKTSQYFQNLIQSSGDGIITFDRKGRVTSWNNGAKKIYGYTAKEILGKTLLRAVPSQNKKEWRARLRRIMVKGETIRNLEIERVRKDGERIWLMSTTSPIRDTKGNIIGASAIVRDITERKWEQEALWESEERNKGLIKAAFDGFVIHQQGVIKSANRAYAEMLGCTVKEIIGKPVLDLTPPDWREFVLSQIKKGVETPYEALGLKKDGTRINIEVCGKNCLYQGQPARLAAVRNITERKQAEEALRKSEEKYRTLFEESKDSIFISDKKGRFIDINQAAVECFGYSSKEEMLGIDITHDLYVNPKGRRKYQQHIERIGYVIDYKLNLKKKTGEPLTILETATAIRNEKGVVVGYRGVLKDITEKEILEKKLKESEQMLGNVIFTMGDALIITDLEGKIVQVNQAFERITGYTKQEAIGQHFPYPWLLEEEMSRFILWITELRRKQYLHDFDMHWCSKENKRIAVSLNTTLLRNNFGQPIAMLNTARDISERQRLAEELGNRTRQIELINRIISKANATVEFDEIFRTIVVELEQVVNFDGMCIELLDKNKNSVEVYACQGILEQKRTDGISYPFDQTIAGWVINSRKSFLTDNILDEGYLIQKALDIPKGVRSLYSLPIFLKGEPFGALTMISREANAFSTQALDVFQPVADELGLIIEKMQLFKRVSEDAAYIHNLLDSIDSVVYTVDSNYKIREVNKAWREFAIRSGNPELANDEIIQEKNIFEIIHDEQLRRAYQKVIRDLFSGKIHSYSQELLTHNGDGEKIFHLRINPMIIDDKVTGLVFTNTDITDIKKTEKELQKRNQELLALNAISTTINRSLKLDEILKEVLPKIQHLVPCKVVTIFLLDENEKELVLSHAIGAQQSSIEKLRRLDIEHSATGTIVKTGKPIFIEANFERDPHITQALREVIRAERLQAFAAIPLKSKTRVLGSLNLLFDSPRMLNFQEKQLLSLIGNQLGSAVENAKLYTETVNKSLEIEQRNKELDDFTYVVSHDLKEPLITIEGFSKLLLNDLQPSLNQTALDYFHIIVDSSNRMKTLIDDLLILSRVGRVSELYKDVGVHDLLDEIKSDLEFVIREKNARIQYSSAFPRIYCIETQMKVVFRNLISNALKFNDKPIPEIEIGYHDDNGYYTFFVKDNGIGIERQYFDKIFIIFQRLHAPNEYGGTGAGLTTVKKIIGVHKGKIWVESEVGKGSTLFFTIPKK